jgi:hypothetical protein
MTASVAPSCGPACARLLEAVRAADWSSPEQAHASVVAEMKRFLPSDELQFLMERSIEPVAEQLGLASTTA